MEEDEACASSSADRLAGVFKMVGTIGDFAGHLAGCASMLLMVIGVTALKWWM